MIADYKDGGIRAPHVASKIWASQLEQVRILMTLERAEQLWHWHSLYELGSSVKRIRECLYTNNMPHRPFLSAEWRTLLELGEKLQWSTDKWASATFRDLYTGIRSHHERSVIKDPSQTYNIFWEKVMGRETSLRWLITNQERVTAYRAAHGAFLLGRRRAQMNILLHSASGRLAPLHCRFCAGGPEDEEHLLCSCPFARGVLAEIEDLLAVVTGRGISFRKEDILYGHLEDRGHLVLPTALAIYKNQIMKLRQRLEMDNQTLAQGTKTQHQGALVKKILTTLKERLSSLPDTQNSEMSQRIDEFIQDLQI